MTDAVQVKADVIQETTVNIKITVNNRTYIYMIPAGVPFDEAYTVGLEMASVVKQMQEQYKKLAEEKVEEKSEVEDGQK